LKQNLEDFDPSKMSMKPGGVQQDFVVPASVDVDDEADPQASSRAPGRTALEPRQTPTVLIERHLG